MSLAVEFGKRVKEFRTYRNLTQADLARGMGVNMSAVSLIENGRRKPSLATLIKLADVLQSSIDELIGRDGPETGCLCREIAASDDLDLVASFIKMLSDRRSSRKWL